MSEENLFVPPRGGGVTPLTPGAVEAVIVETGTGRDKSKRIKPFGTLDDDEDPYLITIIAFDPGGTTGWCLMNFWPDSFLPGNKILEWLHSWSAGQFSGEENSQVDRMIDLCAVWPTDSDIVIEDFILREFRMGRELLSPVRITAAFEYQLRWVGVPKSKQRELGPRKTIRQQPSLAKSAMTDERLKGTEFYRPTAGQPHARDAVRHALTWARRKKDGFEWS